MYIAHFEPRSKVTGIVKWYALLSIKNLYKAVKQEVDTLCIKPYLDPS